LARTGSRILRVSCLAGGAVAGWYLLLRGSLTFDIGIGHRVRPLGPIRVPIGAPRETVFDVIAAPYLGKTPHVMRAELEVQQARLFVRVA
jgi:hypothetical protein